jgi:hypothetical protein
MKPMRALLAGLAGGAAMTAGGVLLRLIELAPANLEMIWGSFLTGTSGVGTWLLGLAIHLAIATAGGLLYAYIMERLREPGWRVGLGIAILHFGIAGLLLTVVWELNDAVRAGLVVDPGGYGFGGFFFLFGVHLLYGATMGAVYAPPREPVPTPGSDALDAYHRELEMRR